MNIDEALLRTKELVRLKHFSYSTEQCYCGWIARYARSIRKSSGSSEEKIERFLSGLANQDVSASTQNQAFNAILFFYEQVLRQNLGDIRSLRAKRAETVRVAPSVEETRALLSAVVDLYNYPCRLITRLLYGCGMRVSEPLNLRIKDVRLSESQLIIRGGKGRKDRVVALPCSLVREIKSQIAFARAMWERDGRNGVPVPLPNRLERKYPKSRFAWQWYWLFPAHKTCKHPRTGENVRWRVHEANVQRAVKIAARKIGLDSIITPHCLRHAYATHCLENGASVRDVQSALGHAQLNTTMGYCHADGLRVPSPIDSHPATPRKIYILHDSETQSALAS